MKYIVLVGDGMADFPLDDLGGKTPLEAAKTPNMDYIAAKGYSGLVRTVPKGMSPASDVANLSILGYNPKVCYSGRGPLEAANIGVKIKQDEVAFRCNLVTAIENKMIDYSAGHIKNKEAKAIITYIEEKLGSEIVRFYTGTSYRHLMICKPALWGISVEEVSKIKCFPPHDIISQEISKHLPKGKGAEFIIELMNRSADILKKHEINQVRIDLKENPANMIWLWGQGSVPDIEAFEEKYGIQGVVISAVDLLKGIGRIIGFDVIKVPGATGYYDTNYKGKAMYGIEALKKKDFLFIHVEAPDEAGHNGDLREKITAIEKFDRLVVGEILSALNKNNRKYRLMVLPDHRTPISVRTHTDDPVPFAMCGDGIKQDGIEKFTEAEAKKSKVKIENGYELMDKLILQLKTEK